MEFLTVIILAIVVSAFKFGFLAVIFKALKNVRDRISGYFGQPNGRL